MASVKQSVTVVGNDPASEPISALLEAPAISSAALLHQIQKALSEGDRPLGYVKRETELPPGLVNSTEYSRNYQELREKILKDPNTRDTFLQQEREYKSQVDAWAREMQRQSLVLAVGVKQEAPAYPVRPPLVEKLHQDALNASQNSNNNPAVGTLLKSLGLGSDRWPRTVIGQDNPRFQTDPNIPNIAPVPRVDTERKPYYGPHVSGTPQIKDQERFLLNAGSRKTGSFESN